MNKKKKKKKKELTWSVIQRIHYCDYFIGERDTIRGNSIENRGYLFTYICLDVQKAFLYFDPHVFVLVLWSTPSQTSLNRILRFID